MSLRSSLVVVLVMACGGAEPHDTAAPGETETAPGCPSSAAPERCRDLAAAAASAGNGQLAWAYTVLECQSQGAARCTEMWQRYAKAAPTQTDALNVLHTACDHVPAACEQMASWHAERGHVLAAAAYRKRGATTQGSRSSNSIALATELAAVMHVSGAPRTEAIDEMVAHELRAPVARPVVATRPKAWPMHAAELGTSSDGCVATATRDRHQVPLDKCITEVRPLQQDQIAILNHCSNPINVAYAAARGDRSTAANQFRLERNEARSIGVSHRDVGPLTYAVCADGCRVTGTGIGPWTAQDAFYNCSKSNGL